MIRATYILLVVCLFGTSALAADPGEFIRSFTNLIFQHMDRRQQRRLHAIRQTLNTCVTQYDERACQAIIDAKGMPAAANFSAFVIMSEIEVRRSDYKSARTSLRWAQRYAKQLPNRAKHFQFVRARLDELNSFEGPDEDRGSGFVPMSSPNTPGDMVCDAAAPVVWRSACFKAKGDTKGATLHYQLTQLLRSRRATLRRILECDGIIEQQAQAGLACFRAAGVPDDAIHHVQIVALQFTLILDSYIPE